MNFRALVLICFVLTTRAVFSQLDTTILFELEKIKNVNTSYHEGHPVITSDGKTLYYFVTNHPRNNEGKDDSQDIWYASKNSGGKWSSPVHFDNYLNKRKYNEVLSVVNDGKTLLLAGGKSKGERGMAFSHKKNGEWGKPEYLEIESYEEMNVGRFSGACMTNDMEVIIHYFSEAKEAKYSDLYVSLKTGGGTYSKPEKLNINTSKDDFGPFVTFDNNKLFFSSTRDGGLGDADIYESVRLDDTWLNWSKPINVGAPVNTSGFDAYFTMDASGEHAFTTRSYMSADGGSLDILGLMAKPEIKLRGTVLDQFTKEPLQAHLEVKVLKKGKLFFETNENGRFGTHTIRDRGVYVIGVYAEDYDDYFDTIDFRKPKAEELVEREYLLHPTKPEVYIHGIVYDKNTSQKLSADLKFELPKHHDIKAKSNPQNGYYKSLLHDIGTYKVTISSTGYEVFTEQFTIEDEGEEFYEFEKDFYLSKGQTIVLAGTVLDDNTEEPIAARVKYEGKKGNTGTLKTDKYGSFETQVSETGPYRLIIRKEGYLNYKEDIEISETEDDVFFSKEIRLIPIEIGSKVRLNEVYFDTDKSDLRPESFPELDLVVEFMRENPTLVIEIQGHTDDRGSDEHNMTLSDDRANAVMSYLVQKGVSEGRMSAKGYGETKPEVPNNSDANRQVNRRVQFIIIAK